MYIKINKQNIDPKCTNMPSGVDCGSTSGIPKGCCPSLPDFAPYNYQTAIDYSGPWDFESVMHYTQIGKVKPNNNNLQTIDVIPNTGSRGSLYWTGTSKPSEYDGYRMCRLYPTQCENYGKCKAAKCVPSCLWSCAESTRCDYRIPLKERPECCNINPFVDPADCNASKRKTCDDLGCGYILGGA